MLKLPNRELKQARRLPYIKRHLKINIYAMVTILRLLLFIRILLLTNYTKNGPMGASLSLYKRMIYCWVFTLTLKL